MNSILGSDIHPKRQKMLKLYIILCASIAFGFLCLSFFVKAYNVFYIFIGTVSLCVVSLYFLPKKPKFSRFLFVVNYLFTVFIISVAFGRAAGIEFFYTFLYLLLFIFYSYSKEKKYIFFFIMVTTLFWMLLILKEFNFFYIPKIVDVSPLEIKKYIYPLSFLGNYVLGLVALINFSIDNVALKKIENNSKNEALELLNLKTIFLKSFNKDIRDPLNSIIGLSHILKDDKPREDQKENIKALNISGENLLELLNNVLNLNELESQKTSLHFVKTNIHKLLDDLLRVHRANCSEKNIQLHLKIDNKFPEILLDKVRYQQVLNNLISNSIKFTNEGEINIEIIKKKQTKNTLIFTTIVKDTGIGIPEDKINAIWNKFTQATMSTTRLYGGTGLGLPIVKKIVESMGSKIFIKSKLGEGSAFYFDLENKLSSTSVSKKVAVNSKKKINLSNKKILITDDNKINIMVCKQILKKLKCTTSEAYNGLEALSSVKNNDYDLILMDLNMPIMDGNTAIKEIRKFNTTVPILIITASNDTNSEDFKEDAVSGFIFKPFDPEELLKNVNQIFK